MYPLKFLLMKLLIKLSYIFLIILTTPMVVYQIQNVSAQNLIQIPVRWCWVEGSPSTEDPSSIGEASAHDILWRRHERASDGIFIPEAEITFRSGYTTTIVPPTFYRINDTGTIGGALGDVRSDDGFTEFLTLINDCRAQWEEDYPDVVGITSLHINQFVNSDGTPSNVWGLGGVPHHSVQTSQDIGGRAMLVDNSYLQTSCGNIWPDIDRKLVAHEYGHALSLQHGNGLDDDHDGDLDEDTDNDGHPNEPGDSRDSGANGNVMQYQNTCSDFASSIDLTQSSENGGTLIGQVEWIRDQANLHIPDLEPGASTSPLGSVKVDEIGEVPTEPYLDIDALTVTIEPRKDSTSFALSTFGLIPTDLDQTLNYYFLADLDNNPTTGITSGDLDETISASTEFNGAELVGRVQLTLDGSGNFAVNPTVWKNENGILVQIPNNNNIKADVLTDLVAITPSIGTELTSYKEPISNIIVLTVSNEVRGLVTSDSLRLEAISENLNTGASDNQNHVGKNFPLVPPEFPVCQVEPRVATFGQNVIAHAIGLSPSSPVHVILGDEEVATGETDSTGSVFLNFEIPQDTKTGLRLITVGTGALTSDCSLKVVTPDLFPGIPP